MFEVCARSSVDRASDSDSEDRAFESHRAYHFIKVLKGWAVTMMTFKYIASSDKNLTTDKIYEVIGVENGYYRIVDDNGKEGLFPPQRFELAIED